jgi:hypothetical protein
LGNRGKGERGERRKRGKKEEGNGGMRKENEEE